MKLKFLVLLACCYCLSGYAQTKIYKNEVGFQTDNDGFLFRGSDRYYTAGNFIHFNHTLKVANADSTLKNKVLGFEFGQKIYTSQSAFIPGAAFIDRPFAGLLFLNTTLNLLYKNQSNLKLQAQVAIVGPNSGGEEVQNLIHRVFHFYKPNGWQYQVQNDYELNLAAEYNRLLSSQGWFDITANSNAAIGTGFTAAAVGFTARFGKFNPLYNSATTGSNISRTNTANKMEAFLYAKPQFTLVAYDATIEGSLFANTPAANEVLSEKVPTLLSEQLGGTLVTGHFIIDLSATYQTRTTQKMVHRQGHQWGSLSVSYRF